MAGLRPVRRYTLDSRKRYIITVRVAHHHHHPGQAHPPATISPSILRLSAAERLAAVAVLIALIWGAVIWAMAA